MILWNMKNFNFVIVSSFWLEVWERILSHVQTKKKYDRILYPISFWLEILDKKTPKIFSFSNLILGFGSFGSLLFYVSFHIGSERFFASPYNVIAWNKDRRTILFKIFSKNIIYSNSF